MPKKRGKSSSKLQSLKPRPAKDSDKVRGGADLGKTIDIDMLVQLTMMEAQKDASSDLRDMLESMSAQRRKG